MGRERAKTYADRLPPLVPREEPDISHLSDEMADVLYPGRRPRPFRMGVAFDAFEGPEFERALALARRSSTYREHGGRHHAAFDASGADALHDLYGIVGGRRETDVLVDGRKVPYAAELWLPLMWLMRRGET